MTDEKIGNVALGRSVGSSESAGALRRLHNDITEAVVYTLDSFDCKPTERYLPDNAVWRYQNEVLFHARVKSLTVAVMRAIERHQTSAPAPSTNTAESPRDVPKSGG